MISTVPTYADELILLVYAAFLNSDSLSKNKFFDRLKIRRKNPANFFYFTTVSIKRIRMVATWARVALPWGRSLPSEPFTSPTATAHERASTA